MILHFVGKNDSLLYDFPYFFMPFYTTLQRDWKPVLKSIVSYLFWIQNSEIHTTKGQPIRPSSFIDVTCRLTLRTVKRIDHPHFTNKIRKFRRLKVDKFAPPCSLMWCTAYFYMSDSLLRVHWLWISILLLDALMMTSKARAAFQSYSEQRVRGWWYI